MVAALAWSVAQCCATALGSDDRTEYCVVTKVLVVDDSITMRALFSRALDAHRDLAVVGAANGADEAREMIARLRPTVITLDVEMPGKNGLEFLEELMKTTPLRVVMLSGQTQKGSDISKQALDIGAVACFPKPQRVTPGEFDQFAESLCQAVLTAAKAPFDVPSAPAEDAPVDEWRDYMPDGRIIAIAGSMQAMDATIELLSVFPNFCPPTLVVLDMDEGVALPFAARLAEAIRPQVKMARHGAPLVSGTVLIAADPNRHVVIDRWPGGVVQFVESDPVNGARPSADRLFGSLAKARGQARAIMLQGVAHDGAAGLAVLCAAGGHAFGQSPEAAPIIHSARAACDRAITTLALPEAIARLALETAVANAA